MVDSNPYEPDDDAKIILRSAAVDDGIGLAMFGRVLGSLSEALRLHARAVRGEPGRRLGTTSSLDEAVTDFRVVRVEPGSVKVVLRPPAAPPDALVAGEHTSLASFRSLIRDISAGSLQTDVADALERGVATLGAGATISFERGADEVWVDRERIRRLRTTSTPGEPKPLRIVGRLRALDLDRSKIIIRTAQGMVWSCAYEEILAERVIESINRVVIAHGLGVETGPAKGRIELQELEIVPEALQTPLFDLVPKSISELLAEQDVPARRPSLIPEDASDEETDRFLNALDVV